ncbi:hypothetical protein IH575_04530 [Candidatus Dojkabacteria bacterium]|nr:hypothetical protein [Candidatus Dojkabacteria bacterium]
MCSEHEKQGIGIPTLNQLRDEVARRGIYNTATRKPYSYSTMHYILSRVPRSSRGKLIDQKSRKTPVIVRMKKYPKITEYMLNTIDGDVIDEDDLTLEAVKGKHVYGMGNLAILMHAKQVWWLGSTTKNLTTVDEIKDEYRWKKVHIIIDN